MFSVLAFGLAIMMSVGVGASNLRKMDLVSRKIKASQRSGIHERALSSTNVSLAEFYRGTDLQWFANISVGTPQSLTVVFDTGSASLEIASTQCGKACSNQVQFNTSKSSTFTDGGHNFTLSFTTGVGVDPVNSPDDYKHTLRNGTDTVSVGGLSADKWHLGCIICFQLHVKRTLIDRIIGISSTAQGLFKALIEQGFVRFYITPRSVGSAELTIGDIDHSKFKGDLVYSSLPTDSTFDGQWQLPSSQIHINGKTSHLLTETRIVIFDTGTNNVLFDTNATEAIYSMISSDIKPFTAENGTYGIACSKIPQLSATLDITFKSTDGKPFKLTIPSCELNVGPFASDSSICQTLINAFDGMNIVGGSLLKHYYSVFDIGSQRVGFACNGVEHC